MNKLNLKYKVTITSNNDNKKDKESNPDKKPLNPGKRSIDKDKTRKR